MTEFNVNRSKIPLSHLPRELAAYIPNRLRGARLVELNVVSAWVIRFSNAICLLQTIRPVNSCWQFAAPFEMHHDLQLLVLPLESCLHTMPRLDAWLLVYRVRVTTFKKKTFRRISSQLFITFWPS